MDFESESILSDDIEYYKETESEESEPELESSTGMSIEYDEYVQDDEDYEDNYETSLYKNEVENDYPQFFEIILNTYDENNFNDIKNENDLIEMLEAKFPDYLFNMSDFESFLRYLFKIYWDEEINDVKISWDEEINDVKIYLESCNVDFMKKNINNNSINKNPLDSISEGDISFEFVINEISKHFGLDIEIKENTYKSNKSIIPKIINITKEEDKNEVVKIKNRKTKSKKTKIDFNFNYHEKLKEESLDKSFLKELKNNLALIGVPKYMKLSFKTEEGLELVEESIVILKKQGFYYIETASKNIEFNENKRFINKSYEDDEKFLNRSILSSLIEILKGYTPNIHQHLKNKQNNNTKYKSYLIEYLINKTKSSLELIINALDQIIENFNVSIDQKNFPKSITNNTPNIGGGKVQITPYYDFTNCTNEEIKKINNAIVDAISINLKPDFSNYLYPHNVISSENFLKEVKNTDSLLYKFCEISKEQIEQIESILEKRNKNLTLDQRNKIYNENLSNISLYDMIENKLSKKISCLNNDKIPILELGILSKEQWNKDILLRFNSKDHYIKLKELLKKYSFSDERLQILHKELNKNNHLIIDKVNKHFGKKNSLNSTEFYIIFEPSFINEINKNSDYRLNDVESIINNNKKSTLNDSDLKNIESIISEEYSSSLELLRDLKPYFEKMEIIKEISLGTLDDISNLYNGFIARNSKNSFWGPELEIVKIINNAIKNKPLFYEEYLKNSVLYIETKISFLTQVQFIKNKYKTIDKLENLKVQDEKSFFIKMWRSLLSVYHSNIFVYTYQSYQTESFEIETEENNKDLLDSIFTEISDYLFKDKRSWYFYYLKHKEEIEIYLYKNQDLILNIDNFLKSNLYSFLKEKEILKEPLENLDENIKKLDKDQIDQFLKSCMEYYVKFIQKVQEIVKNKAKKDKDNYIYHNKTSKLLNNLSSLENLNVFIKEVIASSEKSSKEIIEELFNNKEYNFEKWFINGKKYNDFHKNNNK